MADTVTVYNVVVTPLHDPQRRLYRTHVLASRRQAAVKMAVDRAKAATVPAGKDDEGNLVLRPLVPAQVQLTGHVLSQLDDVEVGTALGFAR